MTTAATGAATGVSPSYSQLCARLREIGTVGSIRALLSWDQETIMPEKAGPFRAEQLSLLSRLRHERATDPGLGDLISACEDDAKVTGDPVESANLREIRHDYDRATKLPAALVSEISETTSRAMHVWRDARAKSDFSLFRPWLEKVVELNKRKAECYGFAPGGELYDALIEDFEPGATAAEIDGVFTPLRERLSTLIKRTQEAKTKPNETLRHVKLPVEEQKAFNRDVAVALRYDEAAGRLDVSTHPFSEPVAPGDTRMTTRYAEDAFLEGLLATMHETGHTLYEQQLPKDTRFGQPLGEAVSLGIHESQSRLIENQVGRSRAFWAWALPLAQQRFGAAMAGVTLDDAVGSACRVAPSFIRVEADETTYGLHVMLRFDAERALMRGDLAVKDIPAWWNARMKQDFGLDVPDDRRGCLQDIHWSMGTIGYFPTYLLGSLHAAQMWEVILRDIPGIEAQFERGDFAPLAAWLGEHVHAHGRRFRAGALIERISGKPLSAEPFMAYLEAKLAPLYAL